MAGEADTTDKSAQANTETDETKPTDATKEQSTSTTTEKGGDETLLAEKVTTEKKSEAPEKYELKLPEDSQLDEAVLDRTAAYAKKRGLSNADAQELVDQQNQAVADHLKASREIADGWVNEVKADKELGGDNFKKSSELAKRVVNRFGSDLFKTALIDTGMGNHPELLRFCYNIGLEMGDDTLVIAGTTSSAPQKDKKAYDVMYDGPKEQPETKE